MEEIVFVEGPVIKLGSELILLITLAKECSGLSSSSEFSECLKLVIPENVAGIMQIQAGDMVCMRSAEGGFRLVPLKAGIVN